MKILLDLDCYFVSAERTVNKDLVGRCVAVGGRNDPHIFSNTQNRQIVSLENSGAFVPSIMLENIHKEEGTPKNFFVDPDGRVRGILTTASYEARAKGVKTPMPIAQALQLCPELIILPPNFKLYHQLSQELRAFLQKRIPLLEQFSIDEFFGDLQGWIPDEDVPAFIHQLKVDVLKTLNLPLSIGAAPSKWIAKMASGMAKPYGTKVILPKDHYETLKDIPIEKFPGIGTKLQEKFHAMQFHTLKDIIHAKAYFDGLTPSMQELWQRVNGTDTQSVKAKKPKKSIGVSRTFDPIVSRKEVKRRLSILSRHLAFTTLKAEVNPTSFHLYIRYELSGKAKGHVTTQSLFSEQSLRYELQELFDSIDVLLTHHIISLSLSVGRFSHQTKQSLNMFTLKDDTKKQALSQSSQSMRQKYGVDILKWANEIEEP